MKHNRGTERGEWMNDVEVKEAIAEIRSAQKVQHQKVTEIHTVLFLNGMLKATKDTQEKLQEFLANRGATCPVVQGKMNQSVLDRKTLTWIGIGIAFVASLPAWVVLFVEVL